jgi:hypothetical protein
MPGPVEGSTGESGVTTWTKAGIWRFFAQFRITSPSSGSRTPVAPPT